MIPQQHIDRWSRLALAVILSLNLTPSSVAENAPDNATRLKVLEGYVTKGLALQEANLLLDTPNPTTRDLSHAALSYIVRDHDYAKSEKTLNYLFALQNVNPSSPAYGTIPWQQNNPIIKDANAIEFTAMALGPLFMHYGSGFSADFRASAAKNLRAAVVAIRNHKVPPAYTNISLMRAVNMTLLGEYLGDSAVASEGEALLDEWIAFTRENGLSEFGSSVYGGVQNNVAGSLFNSTREPRIQAKAKLILDYLWTDSAANYFGPGEELCGANSRTYSFLKHDYNVNGAFYVLGLQSATPPSVGILSEDSLTWANGVWGKYHLEPRIFELAHTPERIVCERWGTKPGQTRYNYITPHFALGSSSCFYGSQDRQVSLHLASTKKLPILSVVPDDIDSPYGKVRFTERGGHVKIHHLKYAVSTAQEKGAVLELLDLAQGISESAKSERPGTYATTNVILPYLADGLFVDGKKADWSKGNIPVTPQTTIGVLEGKTGVAIRLFHADGIPEGKAASFFLKDDGKDFKDFPAARLVAYHASGSDAVPAVPTAKSGVLILVAECKDQEAFQKFLAQAQQWTFAEKMEGALWQVTATPPAGEAKTKPTLMASLDLTAKTTGPRAVNGKEITPCLMTINGVDISQDVWKAPKK